MIDGPTYRLSQTLARQALPNWHLAQVHHVPFNNEHFARDTHSNRELVPIFDTLQEGRFEAFIQEWEGLSQADLACLVSVLVDSVLFQLSAFPGIKPRLPLSTILATFSIYKKIFAYAPDARRILEIGPGAGFLSLFLKGGPAIDRYSQIEACEGFYLLQSMLNDFAFPCSVDERALPLDPGKAHNCFTRDNLEFEPPCYIELPDKAARCGHYPWWRLGELMDQRASYDVVTANANLREFSHQALHDYLSIIKHVMAPGGVLFAQCLGGQLARDHDALAAKLRAMRLAPIVYNLDGGDWTVSGPGLPARKKYFALGHALLIGEQHPRFEQYFRPEYYDGFHMADEPGVLRMFFPQESPRRVVTRGDLLAMVEARLAVHPFLGHGPGFGQAAPAVPAQAGWAGRLAGARPLTLVRSDKYQHLVTPEYLVPRLRAIVAGLRARNARVVVYAAGAHTEMLGATTCIQDAGLVGVVDANPELHGRKVLGCTVTDSRSIRELRPDAILVASARFQDDIVEALADQAAQGVEVIPIYESRSV